MSHKHKEGKSYTGTTDSFCPARPHVKLFDVFFFFFFKAKGWLITTFYLLEYQALHLDPGFQLHQFLPVLKKKSLVIFYTLEQKNIN